MIDKVENYIVLARKYRPKKLKDVIGQDEVCSVIEGSIKTNRVAHAFLFSGTRGVGKTTFARILSKILNCTEIKSEIIEPCGKCPNCKSIENESNMDVVEIDAASRTGVGDVREIIENINYKPVNAKKKIFIIDEVHMLSKAAFNALLKTLEEPPPDVVFIFATTETEKIPVTIVSRCQQFCLRRVNFQLIAKHLVKIAGLEGYKLDIESSQLIAQCSEGSMRDALSILENVIAKSEKINVSVVREVLGLTDSSSIMFLFENLCKGDVELSLDYFEKLYQQGISIEELAKSLMKIAYNLALIKSGVKKNNEQLDNESLNKLYNMSEDLEMDFIVRFWELMQKYINELSDVFDEKQCFEMIVMRLCYASLIPTPFEVLRKKNTQNISEEKIISNPKLISKNKDTTLNFNKEELRITDDNLARKKINQNTSQEKTKSKNERELEQFAKLVNLIEKKSEMVVAYHLKNSFRLVSFSEPLSNKKAGNIELENKVNNSESKKILWNASKIIESITGNRWILSISNKKGFKSLFELEKEDEKKRIESFKKEKIIKKILDLIPSSEIISIKSINK